MTAGSLDTAFTTVQFLKKFNPEETARHRGGKFCPKTYSCSNAKVYLTPSAVSKWDLRWDSTEEYGKNAFTSVASLKGMTETASA
jgi:hypothetical protein